MTVGLQQSYFAFRTMAIDDRDVLGARSRLERLAVRWFWLAPLCFYTWTASKTPGWVDAPLLAKIVYHGELSTWVNNHNLFTLVGGGWLWLMPASLDPHRALNLLCAVLGAATVYCIFRIGLRLTDSVFASALGATVVTVSHSLWWHSTMLEVYTLSTLLLSAVVLFVVRYEQRDRFADICLAALCFGFACSNHPQMALLLFGFVGLLFWPPSRGRILHLKELSILSACFLAGFQVYLWVFALDFAGYVESAPEAQPSTILTVMLERTTGGGFRQYMFPAGLSIHDRLFWWAFYAAFFIYNFPLPWLLYAPIGAIAWLRKKHARASMWFFALALLAQVIWSANYFVWDMYAFSLPAYVMTSLLVILGIDWTRRRCSSLRVLAYALVPTVGLVPFLYSETPDLINGNEQYVQLLSRVPQYEQAKAFWDPLRYFFDPNKHSYDRVERYATVILDELEPNACYWGNEATIFYPLKYYYQDVLQDRRDVSYHLLFGIIERDTEFRHHAAKMVRQLDRGCPVYVSSLGYPERNVLNHAYQALGSALELHEIAALSEETLTATFPRYQFDAAVIDASEGVQIYRLRRRGGSAP